MYPIYTGERDIMTVIEKINEINVAIKEVFEFTQTNETIRNDFSEYLATIGAKDITPNQMRNQILLEKAKDILITTDMSVENISDYLQFSSPSYFKKSLSGILI